MGILGVQFKIRVGWGHRVKPYHFYTFDQYLQYIPAFSWTQFGISKLPPFFVPLIFHTISFIKFFPLVFKQNHLRPGAVAQACNPSTLGGQVGRLIWSHWFETTLVNIVRPHLYRKLKKLARHADVLLLSPSYSGSWGGRTAQAQEFEAAVSSDYVTALQPG